MTCIVAVSDGSRVTVGADSASVADESLMIRADQKIFKLGELIIGFTSSFRMGQVLQHLTQVPKAPSDDRDLMRYMVAEFIPAIRSSLRDAGFSSVENNVESGGTFIVAIRSKIFCVYSDFQIASPACDYAAVGCGDQIAEGSLFSTEGESVERRVEVALRAAQAHCSAVRSPFYTLSTSTQCDRAKKLKAR